MPSPLDPFSHGHVDTQPLQLLAVSCALSHFIGKWLGLMIARAQPAFQIFYTNGKGNQRV